MLPEGVALPTSPFWKPQQRLSPCTCSSSLVTAIQGREGPLEFTDACPQPQNRPLWPGEGSSQSFPLRGQ